MKCRKNDWVVLTNGKKCRVVHGTNSENGLIDVIEHFTNGWVQQTCHRANEIVSVKKRAIR